MLRFFFRNIFMLSFEICIFLSIHMEMQSGKKKFVHVWGHICAPFQKFAYVLERFSCHTQVIESYFQEHICTPIQILHTFCGVADNPVPSLFSCRNMQKNLTKNILSLGRQPGLIPSPSPSVKIQIMGRKVSLRCKLAQCKRCWWLSTNFLFTTVC